MGLRERCPPLIGFLAGEHPRRACAGNVATEKKLEKRVMHRHGLWLHRDLVHAVRLEETRQLSAYPPVLHPIAEGLRDLARRLLVRRVAELRLPIEVEDRHAPARL